MIPRDFITEWRANAPWVSDFQVEQDLVICRALVGIFTHPVLREALAFRGGTALYKLYLTPAARYSEDIDLVQVKAEPAGAVMDALRDTLNPWLGKPQWKQTEGRVTLNYRFLSEDPTPLTLKLKVEINTREHFSEHGFQKVPFSVTSRWFNGACDITTYDLDELLGTKLRALYQRRKGRDLFDMATALSEGDVDPARIVAAFSRYMREEGHRITRAAFEENLAAKVGDARFQSDVPSLLTSGRDWNVQNAADLVLSRICPLLE
ncbi:MAG: nucleotidyl transferase AbiEii/AbiGii toxin family protein [bacterium]|nr:nucleotidyl transferase AbiEii/AbiGii toxin family protein [bacterium]